jgi:flagellar hook-length control protein FliK
VPEPYVVEGDFFDIQEAGLAPQPVPVEKPVVDDPIAAGAPTRPAPQQPVQTPPSTESPSVSPSTNEPAPGVPPPAVQTPASEPQQKVDGTKVAPEKVVEVAKSADVAQSEPRQVERAKPESSTSQPSVKVSDQPRSVQKPEDAPTAENDSAFREPTTKREPLSATPQISTDNTQTIQATTVVDGKSAIPAAEVQPNAVRSQPLQRTETTEVIRQIVDRAEALAAARPRDGVVIHLEPKDLGSITLTVKSVGNQVDAQIGASNEHVRTALEQNRAHLGQAMEFRGLNLTSVTIDNQTTSSNYSQTQQQLTQQQEDRQARQHLASPAHDDRSTAPSLETIRRSVRKADGVDLWT